MDDVFLSFVKDGVLKLPSQKSNACSSGFPQTEAACIFVSISATHLLLCGIIYIPFFFFSLNNQVYGWPDSTYLLIVRQTPQKNTDVIPVLCCSFHWRSDKNSSGVEYGGTGEESRKKLLFLCPECFKTEFVYLILRREKLILFQVLLHKASILYPKFYQNQWCNLHFQWCLTYALGCDHCLNT